jgi:two-component sensor histidine kinase
LELRKSREISAQKQSQEQSVTLAREAEHRSKNLLANVFATVKLSQSDTPEGLKQAIEGRIQALANVHSLFVQTRWIGADLSEIARQELAPYFEEGETRARINGPQILLKPNVAQSLAVILHELATNAAKYGALSSADGRIDLGWSHELNGRLELRWTETGGPQVQMPTREGFGRRIIGQLVEQVNGRAQFDWRVEGLDCEIIVEI